MYSKYIQDVLRNFITIQFFKLVSPFFNRYGVSFAPSPAISLFIYVLFHYPWWVLFTFLSQYYSLSIILSIKLFEVISSFFLHLHEVLISYCENVKLQDCITFSDLEHQFVFRYLYIQRSWINPTCWIYESLHPSSLDVYNGNRFCFIFHLVLRYFSSEGFLYKVAFSEFSKS